MNNLILKWQDKLKGKTTLCWQDKALAGGKTTLRWQDNIKWQDKKARQSPGGQQDNASLARQNKRIKECLHEKRI